MIPKINKPTRVTRKTAIAIAALIITKTTANDTNFKTATFKSDISDHFLIEVFFYHQKQQKWSDIYIDHFKEMLNIVTNSENDWTGKIVAIKY